MRPISRPVNRHPFVAGSVCASDCAQPEIVTLLKMNVAVRCHEVSSYDASRNLHELDPVVLGVGDYYDIVVRSFPGKHNAYGAVWLFDAQPDADIGLAVVRAIANEPCSTTCRRFTRRIDTRVSSTLDANEDARIAGGRKRPTWRNVTGSPTGKVVAEWNIDGRQVQGLGTCVSSAGRLRGD